MGLGLFARAQFDNWYISPAIAWNYFYANAQRPHLEMTDSEEIRIKIKSLALSLTIGQDFVLSNKTELDWYAMLTKSNVFRSGYQEKQTSLEVKFDDMRLNETALAIGLNLSLPIAEKLRGIINAQVEQQLAKKDVVFKSDTIHLGKTEKKVALNKLRSKLQLGLAYELKPNLTLTVAPYIENSIYGSRRYGASWSLSGRF